jgi:glycosyltransferase involved in cell wall biosynthesis
MSKKNPAILIAGYEIGGQMQLLAETLRKKGYNAHAAAFNETNYAGYQNDYMLGGRGLKNQVKRVLFALRAIFHYDVFHFFWGVSLLSFWRFHLLDLPILRFLKKRVIVHFRGRDILNDKYFEYLLDKAQGKLVEPIPMSRPDQIKKKNKWEKYADIVLISTPNLFEVTNNSILCPQVIDLSYWTSVKTLPDIGEKQNIKIVHAPTRRHTKGTEIIIDAVETLKTRGFNVELILLENLHHSQIKEMYEECDFGIDQLLIGWYGKASVELMALGKPVVCYINQNYTGLGEDLPIVNANPETLIHELAKLITDKRLREEIGIKAKEYVTKYHDVNKIADQLIKIYGIDNLAHILRA